MANIGQLVRRALGVWVALFVMSGLGMAHAADPKITLIPDTDLPGFDYQVIKDTSLKSCQQACADDKVCRAFTFNGKAGWCFLKGDVGPETAFKGATSGTVLPSPDPAVTLAVRQEELPFPAADLVDTARGFATALRDSDPPPEGSTYADLVAEADGAAAANNPAAALVAYRQALGINGNDAAVWLRFAQTALVRADLEAQRTDSNDSYDLAVAATSAAMNSFLRSTTTADRAASLAALAHALELRQMWRESIASYRTSVALVDDAAIQGRLETVVSQHGFRVVSNAVDAEAATPRICAVFSDPLPATTDLSRYVVVDDPKVAVETEESQICLEGVEHGRRYNLKLRSGLPSADGETLTSDVELSVYVPDRAPFVGFANTAYVMPAGLGGGLPITSVNADRADVAIYRIGDRSIATAVRNGLFGRTLDQYSAEDVANQNGEKVWEGQVDLARGENNAMTTTAIPVQDAIGAFQPGAYVVTAKVTGSKQEYWQEVATQWFIVTDLGLTTVSGEDGVHAFVRALGSAQPVAGATVRLVAVNNEILGEGTTDAMGRADFAPGLARGEGGRAPQLLVAETAGGDYAFLDLTKTAFDLTDRGVEGRPFPGPLDLFATTERGVYRPGETVFLTALLRDIHADAVEGLKLTLQVERPDGVVASTEVVEPQGAGSYYAELPMGDDAMRGSWHAKLYADPEAAPLSDTSFLVEDFEPERLAFDVSLADEPVVAGEVTEVAVTAKYLYGATAPNLRVEADAQLRPVSTLKQYPGYEFGRSDDTVESSWESLGLVGTTDESGNATAELTLPEPQVSTRPMEALLTLRLVDSNGRAIQRSLTRPVLADGDRIGIRSQFDQGEGLAEGSEAAFDVIAVAPTGETVDKPGLSWTLSKLETSYQWYRGSDGWKWEPITTSREVANGTVDATATGPVTVAAPVRSGRYQLAIESTGDDATSSSYDFYAGYFYADPGSDTPDTLQVALDKPAYRSGETAMLQLDPQFAGTALVMVVDNRIIHMEAVAVPAEGISVPLTVTDDWGPGAYVTAMLYRPSDAAEKRMPARALGLAFADVDPGQRLLHTAIEAPREALPRQPVTAKVKLDNVAPGETAYVAVAAVDLGILNLTQFKVPDPDGWYFGQRQLGMEIRDLYGKLIDPTQGLPGALRSGGDGGGARLGTPPATSVLVALHSGIVEVGPDGIATVSFDMPDFSGTVRLMAMAWTKTAVGHASADVIVRDPVVVTLSPPRFLRVGDDSRLLVEINNVSGPAGAYRVRLETGAGIETDGAENSVDLAAGARTALDLKLHGVAMGDEPIRLVVTGPDGTEQVKELVLGVRPTSGAETRSRTVTIAPGDTLTLDQTEFKDMLPNTGTLTLALGPMARLDVPHLLLQLDRYPYGCAEQVTSRAIPLIYLNEVASMIGLGSDEALQQRIRDAIADVLSKQNSAGSFGLWGPDSSSDFWLDSYVTDFLLRAKAEGYDVPELALTMALDSLSNQLAYATDFTSGGEDLAYALYDLARAGRAAIGDLRYYMEAKLSAFTSPLAKAQIGAALALYGDRTRSTEAFKAAVDALQLPEDKKRWRTDYGSRLRDTAGVLALAAEFTPSGVDLPALTKSLADQRDLALYTSTQEDAWTLLAAAALGRDTAEGKVTVDGEALDGAVYRRFEQEHFDAAPVVISNSGNRPLEAKVSVTAIPAVPPPARSTGFTITRDFYLPDGTPFDPSLSTVSQNDRFVVVLTMASTELGSGQYVVNDPLPAGFEIENPNLVATAGASDLSWLTLDTPVHVESRTDSFVAAFRYTTQAQSFATAYVVRAVTPGIFVLPGATVEDMYRPELRANTEAGSFEIGATGP